MLKKRIFVLTILLLVIISNICFAEVDERWVVLQQDGRVIISLEKNYFRFYINRDSEKLTINCQIKENFLEEDLAIIDHVSIYINKSGEITYTIKEEFICKGGKYVTAKDRLEEGLKKLDPETYIGTAMLKVIDWTVANHRHPTVSFE